MTAPIKVGDRVRLLGLPDWITNDLPNDEKVEMYSFIGKCAEVEQIDEYGYYWIGFGTLHNVDGTSYYSGHSFCVPVEFIVFEANK
jgi:hypothetical protein